MEWLFGVGWINKLSMMVFMWKPLAKRLPLLICVWVSTLRQAFISTSASLLAFTLTFSNQPLQDSVLETQTATQIPSLMLCLSWMWTRDFSRLWASQKMGIKFLDPTSQMAHFGNLARWTSATESRLETATTMSWLPSTPILLDAGALPPLRTMQLFLARQIKEFAQPET